jgi:hypothetical protein
MEITLTINEKNITRKNGEIFVKIDNAEIIKLLNAKRADEFEIGEVLNFGGLDWVVLDKNADGVAVITKELLKDEDGEIIEKVFDNKSPNFAKSSLRSWLNGEFLQRFDIEQILAHTTDLTADDGLNDFGDCLQKIGLLTCEQYRRFVKTLDRFPVGSWWWTATPDSGQNHYKSELVRYVGYNGTLYYNFCNFDCGVRPFCILKSSANVTDGDK